MSDEIISITELHGGAGIKLMDDAIARAVANVLDPNTSATKTRKVQLTVTLNPNEDRSAANCTIAIQTSMAPPKERDTRLFFGIRSDGTYAAKEVHVDQMNMFDSKTVDEKIDDADNVDRIDGGVK